MQIIIGSDHAGFNLKQTILKELKKQNIKTKDVGTFDKKSVDYPDFAEKVSKKVASNKNYKGIMLCGSGIGSCIICNKFKNIRAGICHDTYSAHQGVEHNNMNLLVMGELVIGKSLALEILNSFIKAKFKEKKRYNKRLNKLKKIEDHNFI